MNIRGDSLNVNLNDIIGKLGAKIANLEIQLAHAQAANEAYLKRIKELEVENKELETRVTDAELTTNNTPVCTCDN